MLDFLIWVRYLAHGFIYMTARSFAQGAYIFQVKKAFHFFKNGTGFINKLCDDLSVIDLCKVITFVQVKWWKRTKDFKNFSTLKRLPSSFNGREFWQWALAGAFMGSQSSVSRTGAVLCHMYLELALEMKILNGDCTGYRHFKDGSTVYLDLFALIWL